MLLLIGAGVVVFFILASKKPVSDAPATLAEKPKADSQLLTRQSGDIVEQLAQGIGAAVFTSKIAQKVAVATLALSVTVLFAFGPVVACVVLAIGWLIATFIEGIEMLVEVFSGDNQKQAETKYWADHQRLTNDMIEKFRIHFSANNQQVPPDSVLKEYAQAFADGFMRRQNLLQIFQYVVKVQKVGLGGFGYVDPRTAAGIPNVHAAIDRGSRNAAFYGRPYPASAYTALFGGLQTTPQDLRYGGVIQDSEQLVTAGPPRVIVGPEFDSYYEAGKQLANASGFVCAMMKPIGLGGTPTMHAVYWRDKGCFQGTFVSDFPAVGTPCLVYDNWVWGWRAGNKMQPVFIGSYDEPTATLTARANATMGAGLGIPGLNF